MAKSISLENNSQKWLINMAPQLMAWALIVLPHKGKNSGNTEQSDSVLGQVNLTKKAKTVQNRVNQLTFPNMGKMRSLLATAAGLGLAACNSAEATDASKTPEAELQYASVNVETVTRAECLAMEVRDKKMACLLKLKDQREAEIAALDSGLQQDTSEIAVIDNATETEKKANEQRRTTVEVLTEVKEAMRQSDPSR